MYDEVIENIENEYYANHKYGDRLLRLDLEAVEMVQQKEYEYAEDYIEVLEDRIAWLESELKL